MANPMEKPACLKDEHIEYLNKLRESGKTNMFGAAVWLESEFKLERAEANQILGFWMENFTLEPRT